MTTSNLSVVFSPCLLSEADHETTSVAAAMEEDKTMEDLILYCNDVFDLKTAGAPLLPPISPTGAGELSRAGQSAADAAFAAPSPTAESILEAPSPSDLPIVTGANLKRSNAITPAIVADGADAGGSHSRHTSGGSAKETVVPPQVDIPSFSTGRSQRDCSPQPHYGRRLRMSSTRPKPHRPSPSRS